MGAILKMRKARKCTGIGIQMESVCCCLFANVSVCDSTAMLAFGGRLLRRNITLMRYRHVIIYVRRVSPTCLIQWKRVSDGCSSTPEAIPSRQLRSGTPDRQLLPQRERLVLRGSRQPSWCTVPAKSRTCNLREAVGELNPRSEPLDNTMMGAEDGRLHFEVAHRATAHLMPKMTIFLETSRGLPFTRVDANRLMFKTNWFELVSAYQCCDLIG